MSSSLPPQARYGRTGNDTEECLEQVNAFHAIALIAGAVSRIGARGPPLCSLTAALRFALADIDAFGLQVARRSSDC